jgi:hypothetical protein
MSDYLAHNNRPANEAHQMDTTDHQVPTDDCYRLEPAADILDHHDLAGITDQDMPGIFDQYELEASFDQQDHQMDIFEQQGLAQILNQPGPAHIVHQQEPADIVNQQADRVRPMLFCLRKLVPVCSRYFISHTTPAKIFKKTALEKKNFIIGRFLLWEVTFGNGVYGIYNFLNFLFNVCSAPSVSRNMRRR